jgi:hypothetical protein
MDGSTWVYFHVGRAYEREYVIIKCSLQHSFLLVHLYCQIGIFMENQGDSSQMNLDHDKLTDNLYIGDTFAVVVEPSNDEYVYYYILECQKEKFIVQRAFTCV